MAVAGGVGESTVDRCSVKAEKTGAQPLLIPALVFSRSASVLAGLYSQTVLQKCGTQSQETSADRNGIVDLTLVSDYGPRGREMERVHCSGRAESIWVFG